MRMINRTTLGLATLCTAVLAGLTGCGGGGGSSGALANPPAAAGNTWTPGVFQPSSQFAGRCGRVDQNNFLRSWSNELYLWYDEIEDRDPSLFSTPEYFELLKTEALTPSGQPKDRFHFSMSTSRWEALSQSGVAPGYGVEWAILKAQSPDRDVRVAFTEPDSPATSPGVELPRGARVLRIDGVDLLNDNTTAGINTLNAGLFPSTEGETHTFEIQEPGTGIVREVVMASAIVTAIPVQNVGVIETGTGRVGYLLFNDHIATAEALLIDAVNTLRSEGIDDLVIDIRYNGGGFLAIASQLGYMIAGRTRTANRTFEFLRFNDKHTVRNPVTGELLRPFPFADIRLFSEPLDAPLPSLDLDRVFLLVGPDTCSASESIINSLSGIGFPVFVIGETTCGKPYGFYPEDNCGTTYFSIQFKGENEQGFGDYADGFSPADVPAPFGEPLPGCTVADDFSRALGDPEERRLAAALAFRETGVCPEAAAFSGDLTRTVRGLAPLAPTGPALTAPPWRHLRALPR
jgi:carboxyl-terminal processing protease